MRIVTRISSHTPLGRLRHGPPPQLRSGSADSTLELFGAQQSPRAHAEASYREADSRALELAGLVNPPHLYACGGQ
jgi:hypothetical protein